ncbi:AAA family ATPase [Aminobacter aganoensis]|uniref:Dephospho-CoA kinase n=1 Tax=Aminobacter aganoensis TaxID=83264 RepID=A0A7X0KME5_9HYPH|nr:AAA family ATPase [Aminobacter aganoensis]MBB6355949.1 dephospho-CoA kinase [Aminobacter aganoensis]
MTSARARRFALIGKSGAGKSTVAERISRDYGIRRISTGVICRKISLLLFGNEDKASTQQIDDALTQIDPSIFLRAALRGAAPEESICVDSLRFSTDFRFARDQGFEVIRVTASDETRTHRLAARGQAFNLDVDGRHRSETELDTAEADFTIYNDGAKDEIEAALRSIFSRGA